MDDLEAVKQLKARYCRLLDAKDWTAYAGLFTADVVVDLSEGGGRVIEGAEAFLAFLVPQLTGVVTVHHCYMPEISFPSASTAQGVWAMEDRLRFPDGTDVTGFGHYHETYVRTADGWRIKTTRLTRLRLDIVPPKS
ncbi:SnoaL-like protein [Actinocorallia herbida]|uniref:SnoaL-like protein n=1 Tax=Actinocorallia herbida TaxID=58109 RepID=A0A3N1CZ98_9ACTN|nr:nuclear transport factor 2 family protein [Actinocorallia herbida]ROO86589.1 SnoaL-like protein [Actinocorallia herbida]